MNNQMKTTIIVDPIVKVDTDLHKDHHDGVIRAGLLIDTISVYNRFSW